ncbi:NusG domain II-containing protein [Magnetococcus sp. PR-3]|uniref:NusG domain II-containing protein n=1 Tax=Magnetococcus sp. PR-3 TaxID=3120355 RepID=UPI002FCE17F7
MAGSFLKGIGLIRRATSMMDLCIAGGSLGILLFFMLFATQEGANRVEVHQNNQLVQTLALDKETQLELQGLLGRVIIEVKPGAARLREYDSPRMIGVRTGWISGGGRMAICVPCGIFIRIPPAQAQDNTYDAVAR